MSENFAVRIIAPVRALNIYGQISRKFAIALSDAGIITNVSDATQPNDITTEIATEEKDKLAFLGQQALPPKYVTIHINSPERIAFFDTNAVSNIAWTASEADVLPLVHGIILSHPGINEVWVPSQHHKMMFEKYPDIGKKLSVVRWGVDSKLNYALTGFLDKAKKSNGDPKNFYFGFVSSFKKTTGFDIVLKAFYEEFANEPNVKLVLKTYMGAIPKDNEKDSVKNTMAHFKGQSKAEVIYISGALTEPAVDGIISGLDCLVAPYRSKAWGTTILKAMAAGVPTIVNQHAGNRSFCTRENSIQLASRVNICTDLEWLMQNPLFQGSSWAHVNVDDLKRTMRDVYEKKTSLEGVISNGKKTAERYDWSNIVNDAIAALKKYATPQAPKPAPAAPVLQVVQGGVENAK